MFNFRADGRPPKRANLGFKRANLCMGKVILKGIDGRAPPGVEPAA